MVALIDPCEVAMPGELTPWEDIPEGECPACLDSCTPVAPAGLCWRCTERYRCADAGCGFAAALVVASNPSITLQHLEACPECRALFLDLGRTAEVADMEKTPYAVSLAAIA
jgi:hypothetical protein